MKLSITTLLILAIMFLDGTLMTGVFAKPGDGAEATTPSGQGQGVTGGGYGGIGKSRKQCLTECKDKPDAEGGRFCGEFIAKIGKINGVFRNQCELDCRKNFKKSADNSCLKGRSGVNKGATTKPGAATTQKPK